MAPFPAISLRAGETNLVLGLLLPPEEVQANSLRHGVTLAAEDANNSGTNFVRIVIRGRVGQWGADAVEAARMVTDDGAVGLIAPLDGAATHLALQVAGRTAVPVVTLCADSSVSTTGVPWMVRLVPRTTEEAEIIFSETQNRDDAKKAHWALVVPPDRAGRETVRDFSLAALKAHCTFEKAFELKGSEQEIERITPKILALGPDAIFVALDPAFAGAIVKSLRKAGFKGTLAGPGRLRAAEFAQTAGPSLEGFLTTGIALDNASHTVREAFENRFRNRFGYEPDAIAAYSYDAVMLLIRLAANSNSGSLARSFPIGFSVPGTSGPLNFDAEGNRKTKLELLVGRDGRFAPRDKAR